MSVVPGSIDATQGPPMTVPLRHFVVGLGFLTAGTVLGVGSVVGVVPGHVQLVHVHLLLVGWICVTIMGAMTQFVPVWSGTALYSRRLANVQLGLVAGGLLGFAAVLLFSRWGWAIPFGALMLVGFWTFAYNVGRTLATVDDLDVTERHFAVALAFFLALSVLGVLLAVDFTVPVFRWIGVTRAGAVGAHATFAVFGAVLTTVYGALYQLGTMFTGTELRGSDHRLQSIEELGHPLGVVLLGVGRFAEAGFVARIGGILILLAALAFAVVLARKLYGMQVQRTPMHTRYGVVVPALVLWALAAVPAWIEDPTAREHLLGAPGTAHLLVVGVIGFVVLGTLYHVVPFIVWVHRYSDRLGIDDVPMIDDLYDDRLAAIDATLLIGGTGLLVASELIGLAPRVAALGGALVSLGVVVFTANMLLVVSRHGPFPFDLVLLGSLSPRRLVGRSDGETEE